MAVSVRMSPVLEKELELAARRRGITKSQFIVEAVERSLGRRNPYELMLALEAEAERGVYGPTAAAPEEPAGFDYPVDGAAEARAFIRQKLKKKHGGGSAG